MTASAPRTRLGTPSRGGAQPVSVLRAISEAELQQWVTDLCTALHLLHYHTHNSRRSAGGFPDSVIAGRWVLYRELKREYEALYVLPPAQQAWREALAEAGADWDIWRPSDWFPSADYPRGRIRTELEAVCFRVRG